MTDKTRGFGEVAAMMAAMQKLRSLREAFDDACFDGTGAVRITADGEVERVDMEKLKVAGDGVVFTSMSDDPEPTECVPPPERASFDGAHFLEHADGTVRSVLWCQYGDNPGNWVGRTWGATTAQAAEQGYRYLGPAEYVAQNPRWRHVRMGQPAPAGDEYVVLSAEDYDHWRLAWSAEREELKAVCGFPRIELEAYHCRPVMWPEELAVPSFDGELGSRTVAAWSVKTTDPAACAMVHKLTDDNCALAATNERLRDEIAALTAEKNALQDMVAKFTGASVPETPTPSGRGPFRDFRDDPRRLGR